MKTKLCLVTTGTILLFALAGCGKGKLETENDGLKSEVSKLESEDSQLNTKLEQFESTNSELKAEVENYKLENSVLKTKVSGLDEINTLLQKQLESVTSQIQQQTELKKTTDDNERKQPALEAIQAMRDMESFVSSPYSTDEYRQKLQGLKQALDKGTSKITNEHIKDNLEHAYEQYEAGYAVIFWGSQSLDTPFENGKNLITTAFDKVGVAIPDDNGIALIRSHASMRDYYLKEFWLEAKKYIDFARDFLDAEK